MFMVYQFVVNAVKALFKLVFLPYTFLKNAWNFDHIGKKVG